LIYNGTPELKLSEKYSICPNPFSNEATLKTDRELKNATVIISNPFGQQVKQAKNIAGNEIKITRGNLSAGVYFLQVIQENKIILSCKLIIY